ncbi:MAG: 50S ribosomal protein L25 [Patescibacteria group bacterium]|nr:50S ribosomal protein L25 [Patescibacteria group bacterium]
MLKLKAKIRKKLGGKAKELRKEEILPSVLYGSKIETQSIQVDLKEFKNVFKEAGKSSLISLRIDKEEKPVLIHKIEKDPLSGELIHIDFYQPVLTEEIEATVSLVFEGESFAVKDLGGTLVKEIQELTVKALPQNLPHEIKVNVDTLETFNDEILVKDIKLPENVEIKKDLDSIIAVVVPPKKVEEELEKPAEQEEEAVGKTEEKDEAKDEVKESGGEEEKDKEKK